MKVLDGVVGLSFGDLEERIFCMLDLVADFASHFCPTALPFMCLIFKSQTLRFLFEFGKRIKTRVGSFLQKQNYFFIFFPVTEPSPASVCATSSSVIIYCMQRILEVRQSSMKLIVFPRITLCDQFAGHISIFLSIEIRIF